MQSFIRIYAENFESFLSFCFIYQLDLGHIICKSYFKLSSCIKKTEVNSLRFASPRLDIFLSTVDKNGSYFHRAPFSPSFIFKYNMMRDTTETHMHVPSFEKRLIFLACKHCIGLLEPDNNRVLISSQFYCFQGFLTVKNFYVPGYTLLDSLLCDGHDCLVFIPRLCSHYIPDRFSVRVGNRSNTM